MKSRKRAQNPGAGKPKESKTNQSRDWDGPDRGLRHACFRNLVHTVKFGRQDECTMNLACLPIFHLKPEQVMAVMSGASGRRAMAHQAILRQANRTGIHNLISSLIDTE